MANNYTFIDAASVVQTAATSVVAGAHQPLVQVSSIVGLQILSMPITSVMNTVPSSMLVGASIIGLTPVAPTPSSVLAFQGTSPWVMGSVLGTYPENNVHGVNDSGLFVLGVRNDTMASVVNADGEYSRLSVGPAGELVMSNSPITKWVQGNNSVINGTSVQVLAPQGTSVFTYITAVQVRNDSANNVGITFTGGLGGVNSILGYLPAPANSGALPLMINGWKTGANSGVSASISGIASILISMQGFISKT